MSQRSDASAAIASTPEKYKVCDQCESILVRSAAHCAICHGYRWREEHNEVIRVAHMLGSRPPILTPVTPRI